MSATTDRPDATVADRPLLGPPRSWSFPAVERHDVAPGLTVWACDIPGQPLVSVKVLLDAPVEVEPLEIAGVGTITAWALDEGAAERDANDLAAALDRLGAELSTSVNSRGTAVTVDAAPDRIRDATGLLRDVLVEPWFPSDEVARLARQRRDSLAQERARVPGRAGLETRQRLFAPTSRFALPSGGSEDTVARIDRDAVVAHHAERLLPSNVHVVVAGDLVGTGVDPVALVADRLDGVGGGAPTTPPDPDIVPGPLVVAVDRPGAVQTGIEVTRRGVDRHAEDWGALRVATHVLGGTLTSRLDTVLREEKGFTYGSRSSLTTLRRGGWIRLVAGSFDTPTTAEAMADVRRIVGGLQSSGALQSEVEDAVRYLAGVQPLKYPTAGAVAGEVLRNLADGFEPTHTDVEHRALTEVTTDEASAAAARHLTLDDAVVVLVGDVAQFRDGVEEALGAPLEVVAD